MSAEGTPAVARLSDAAKRRFGGVLSLVRGTALAQVVFVLVTPILTRVYSAEELGIFGVYAAVVVIASRVVGLRYEMAAPLPRRDEVALHLVWLTMLVSLGMLIAAGLLYAFAIDGLGLSGESHPLQSHVPVVLAGILMFVLNGALSMWYIRKKEFGTVANSRMINALLLALFQLAGFLSPAKLLVLLGAYPLALAISNFYLLRRLDWQLARYRRSRARLLVTLAGRYRKFPLYTTPTSTISELTQSLPLFVLSIFFGNVQVGYFFMARRIGLVPTSIVGRAISQVNHAEMLEHHRNGVLGDVLLRQIHLLQWVSIVPAVVLAVLAPTICERLLGDEWGVAGQYLQLMTPYVVVHFVFAPVHAINYVAEWQQEGFWVALLSTALSSGVLVWYSANGTAYEAVAGYFAVQCAAYLAYRCYQMHRLGVGLVRLLGPALLQLAALAILRFVVGLS